MSEKKKVILAYSGGLDTSIIIPWLKENFDYEVIAVAGDVGQGEELAPLNEKAIKTGASKIYIEDLRDEFVKDFIFPTIKAHAVYEGKYLLGTSFARPVIAKRLVEIARKEGATAICHGCTGKGNDQVRFELTIKALAPDLEIIAPWRMWDIKSREEEIDYAAARGIDVPVTKKKPYSMDRNLWHLSHEGHDLEIIAPWRMWDIKSREEEIDYAAARGIDVPVTKKKPYSMDRNLWHLSHEGHDLEDPWNEPQDDLLMICNTPEKAPDQAEYVEIEWEKGEPVAVNGEKLAPVALIEKLNELGAKHGIGIADMVENRLVGMKSRGVYETPAGAILYAAHMNLEELCLDRETRHYKDQVAIKFADLVYFGQWYTPLRKALSAFVDSTQETVTGTTRVKLYKGNCTPAGTKSPYSLYSGEFATFEKDEVYNQKDAGGFINCFGLPLKIRAMLLGAEKNLD